MRREAIVFVAALAMAPPGAQAADLVVWWEKGYDDQENEAVREIIAAFEQETGKQVELDLPSYDDSQVKVQAAVEAGQPPDFLFGGGNTAYSFGQWAYEDRLVDLSDQILPFASLFDPDGLAFATLLNAKTGRRALYALPMGFATNHVHVWRNLLEQAGFTLDDIPNQWEAFWAFWCDRVQPAVRRATGGDNIHGVGLPMSAKANDTRIQFEQFMQAYDANYVTREGKLIIGDPEIRRRLIKTMDSYTAIYRKGCTPPDSIDWTTSGNNNNNARFLARMVVMLPNDTLSIPNALKSERADDYYQNTATIEWPDDPDGQPLAIRTGFVAAAVFKAGRARSPGQGVRSLPRGRGLARALSRLLRRAHAAVGPDAPRPALLARSERSAPHGLGNPVPDPPAHLQLLGCLRRSATLGRKRGARLGQGRPPRRRRRHQPRAGGRRGDRPRQADPG